MDKNELQRLIFRKENEYEKAKFKRMILSIIGFGVAYFIVFMIRDKPTGFGIIGTAIAGLVTGGIHFYINAFVFSWLANRSQEENQHLERMKKELTELERRK